MFNIFDFIAFFFQLSLKVLYMYTQLIIQSGACCVFHFWNLLCSVFA